ncbi:MAG: hypothetical protein AAFU53_13720, partial [Cyanobacteria bacterium J06632_3]
RQPPSKQMLFPPVISKLPNMSTLLSNRTLSPSVTTTSSFKVSLSKGNTSQGSPSKGGIRKGDIKKASIAVELPRLSTTQLTERISLITQHYLAIEQLNTYTQQLALIAKKDPSQRISSPAQTPFLQDIAETYAALCAQLWPLAFIDEALPAADRHTQSNTSWREPLVNNISKLCLLWSIHKRQYPDHVFFTEVTGFSALQQKWRQPEIQSSLRQMTNALKDSHPHGHWIDRYPTCWPYAIGLIMHQLLQWNYQLTSHRLREFLM